MRLGEVENTKSQIPNPKQYQMTEIPMSQGFGLEHSNLGVVYGLGIRIQFMGGQA
jgi:hypothetical protein